MCYDISFETNVEELAEYIFRFNTDAGEDKTGWFVHMQCPERVNHS